MKQYSGTIEKKSKSYYITGVITLILAIIIMFPIIYCFSVSFMAESEINSYPPKFIAKVLYFGNYIQVLGGTLLGRFILNSIILAFFATVVRIVTACTSAFAFSFLNFPLKKLFFFLILASMVIPGDALIVTNYLTVTSFGLIDTYLGVMIVYFADAMYMFMLRQYMKSIPPDFRDAAVMDGCGNFRFFTSIIIPICQPITISVFISSFVGLWNAYVWPLLITNAPEMRTIQVGITMLSTEENTAFGPTMAGAIIILIPMIVIFILFKEKIISGVTAGSIKG
jgi:sn-glycerol 3-phosphate transport system permease protein